MTVINMDCRLGMSSMPANSVDAIVTDPPYGLSKQPDMREVLKHWLAGDEYSPGRGNGGKNTHPTVKPTELMRWLCRLVTPPGGRILDPFTGSGSTGRGAVLEGFDFLGFELSAEYAQIAEARIAEAASTR